jgi:hypothetical protein
MRIPNANRAVVDIAKLRDYCLNPKHPRGKNKARLFDSLLGLRAEDAERLRGRILEAVITNEALAGEEDDFGRRYSVDLEIARPETSVCVRTGWIIRTGEDFPRLTTCYIL